MDDQPTRRLDTPPDDPNAEATRRMEAAAPPQRRAAWACPRCQSSAMPIDIYLTAEQRVMAKRQDVLIGWLGGSSPVSAYACPDCGHIELTIDDLDRLIS